MNVTILVDGQPAELDIPSLGFDPPSGLVVSIVMVQQQWKLASIDPSTGTVSFLSDALPIHFPEGINLCEAAYSPALPSSGPSAAAPSGIMYFGVSAAGNDESLIAFDLSLGKIVANETFLGGINVMAVDSTSSDRAVYVVSMYRPTHRSSEAVYGLPDGLRLLRLDPAGAGTIELIGVFASDVVPAYQGVGMFDGPAQTFRVALGLQEGPSLGSSLFSVPVAHPTPGGGLPDGWSNVSLTAADALVPSGLWKLA